MHDGFSRSPVTGFWNHGCGKPKRAWWEAHVRRIAATTPDP